MIRKKKSTKDKRDVTKKILFLCFDDKSFKYC